MSVFVEFSRKSLRFLCCSGEDLGGDVERFCEFYIVTIFASLCPALLKALMYSFHSLNNPTELGSILFPYSV